MPVATATKPVRRQQPRTADRRSMIEDIAARLFAERGYNGVSLRDIGHSAQVKLGSLFYLYQEKQALYDRILQQAIEHFAARIIAAIEAVDGSYAQLRALIHVMVREHVEETVQGQLIARELTEPRGGRFPILGLAMLQRLRELLNPAIREISGRPLSDDEANRLTGQIINMIYAATRSQTLYIGAFGLAAQDVDRLAGDLEHLILHGLLPRPEPEAAARS